MLLRVCCLSACEYTLESQRGTKKREVAVKGCEKARPKEKKKTPVVGHKSNHVQSNSIRILCGPLAGGSTRIRSSLSSSGDVVFVSRTKCLIISCFARTFSPARSTRCANVVNIRRLSQIVLHQQQCRSFPLHLICLD